MTEREVLEIFDNRSTTLEERREAAAKIARALRIAEAFDDLMSPSDEPPYPKFADWTREGVMGILEAAAEGGDDEAE